MTLGWTRLGRGVLRKTPEGKGGGAMSSYKKD